MEIDTHGTLDSKDAPPDGFLYQDTRPKGFEFHHVRHGSSFMCSPKYVTESEAHRAVSRESLNYTRFSARWELSHEDVDVLAGVKKSQLNFTAQRVSAFLFGLVTPAAQWKKESRKAASRQKPPSTHCWVRFDDE